MLSMRLGHGTNRSMHLNYRKAILHMLAPVDQGDNMSTSAYNLMQHSRVSSTHKQRTETKAITAYPVGQLLSILPKSLHPNIRKSKYYTSTNDSLTFQAQDSRSRDANAEDNRRKLTDEVVRIYKEATPAETSVEKRKKHEEM
jgi:hypothetical protein